MVCLKDMKHEYMAISGVSLSLLTYLVLLSTGVFHWAVLVFALSPFLIIWMAWVVLKYGTYAGQELAESQEFGYADRPSIGLDIRPQA